MRSKSTLGKLLVAFGVLSFQACSGQVPKNDLNALRNNQGEADSGSTKVADAEYKGARPNSGDAEGTQSGGGSPALPEPNPNTRIEDEPVVAPQPVTGSPSGEEILEKGQPLRNAFYKIQSNYSKKCLTVHQGLAELGRKIVQGNCDSEAAVFKLSYVDKQYFVITNRKTQYAVQLSNQLAENEARLDQGDYRAHDFQKWKLHKQSDGTFHIRPVLNDKLCADVAFGSLEDNAFIQLWKDCAVQGAKWILREQP